MQTTDGRRRRAVGRQTWRWAASERASEEGARGTLSCLKQPSAADGPWFVSVGQAGREGKSEPAHHIRSHESWWFFMPKKSGKRERETQYGSRTVRAAKSLGPWEGAYFTVGWRHCLLGGGWKNHNIRCYLILFFHSSEER